MAINSMRGQHRYQLAARYMPRDSEAGGHADSATRRHCRDHRIARINDNGRHRKRG